VLFSRTHFMKLARRPHHSIRTLFYFMPRSTLLVTRPVGYRARAASSISPPLSSICPSPSAVSHLVSFIHPYWSSPLSPSSRAFLVIALSTLTTLIMCHKLASFPFQSSLLIPGVSEMFEVEEGVTLQGHSRYVDSVFSAMQLLQQLSMHVSSFHVSLSCSKDI
jgi:hypothetical protein